MKIKGAKPGIKLSIIIEQLLKVQSSTTKLLATESHHRMYLSISPQNVSLIPNSSPLD
jgi:hypothetical protein